ncbi:MAG TPA: type II secretion system F family protein [Actinotalea sp.]|nr:type II secretion system F family protein [Actinotalea sp.]
MAAQVPVAVVLDLLVAACGAGASVPGALSGVGLAIGGHRGDRLREASARLVWGASWPEAWAGAPGELEPVADALRPAWEQGAPPAGGLRAAAEQVRREGQAAALEAAARLGVRLVLPLGLCHLPAFVLVGIVPVVVALLDRAFVG